MTHGATVADRGLNTLPNDFVFVFASGDLPTKFFASSGIKVDTRFGQTLGQSAVQNAIS